MRDEAKNYLYFGTDIFLISFLTHYALLITHHGLYA